MGSRAAIIIMSKKKEGWRQKIRKNYRTKYNIPKIKGNKWRRLGKKKINHLKMTMVATKKKETTENQHGYKDEQEEVRDLAVNLMPVDQHCFTFSLNMENKMKED